MKKGAILYGMACFALGAAIGGGGIAYASGVIAEKSTLPFFLNGSPVEVEAYLINENNYMKLRDIAALVDFGVTWDPATSSVHIDTTTGYTPEGQASAQPTQEPTPAKSAEDYTTGANQGVFTATYTRDIYNAFREVIVNGGDSQPFAITEGAEQALMNVEAATLEYRSCDVVRRGEDTAILRSRISGPYQKAAQACQPFIDSLAGKSDSDKVYDIACYVCERLDYEVNSTTTPATLFTEAGVHQGNCMSFAHGFKFLCDMAGVPCVFVHSSIHQWNECYVDGRWYTVDLTSFDIGYNEGNPWKVLHDQSEAQGRNYVQTDPALTMFAKELLVPGSTK